MSIASSRRSAGRCSIAIVASSRCAACGSRSRPRRCSSSSIPKRAPIRADHVVIDDAELTFSPSAFLPSLGRIRIPIDHAESGPTVFVTPLSWIFSLTTLRAHVELPAGLTVHLTYDHGVFGAAGSLFGSTPVAATARAPGRDALHRRARRDRRARQARHGPRRAARREARRRLAAPEALALTSPVRSSRARGGRRSWHRARTEVRPAMSTADLVRRAPPPWRRCRPFCQDNAQRTCMIFHIKPIADVAAVTVNG